MGPARASLAAIGVVPYSFASLARQGWETQKMNQFGIGQPVRRKGDVQSPTRGAYSKKSDLVGRAHLPILRSPRAHASILSFDVAAVPGVLHG